MRLRLFENYRFVLYAPFYAAHAIGAYSAEGVEVVSQAGRLTGADPRRVREVARTAASPDDLPPAQELYEQIATVMGVQP